ncbi:MAG: M14 family metallopeptidase [Anaerolineales bacterium]|nr:M14 family metallopeptidase [Anaerolineales bacterium]
MNGLDSRAARALPLIGIVFAAVALILSTSTPAYGRPGPPTPPTRLPLGVSPSRQGSPTTTIGWSVEERPLVVHRFGTGPSKRMIVAGIHGGYEWNTTELAYQLIEFLERNADVVPQNVTLYVLPLVNPDGAARSQGYEGRANSNGVDLNRNFPHQWQHEWPTGGCWSYLPIHGGDHPFSEPESKALARFILAEHVEALISYHSAALGIFSGGRPEHPGSTRLAEAVAGVTEYPYPPLDTGCEYTGQLTDWAAANGISAVDVELTTHYSIDFEQNLRVLFTFLYFQP